MSEEMSLLEFQQAFGSEEACLKYLFEKRWPEEFQCPHCGHGEYYFLKKRRLYQCRACGYQASVTAGTIFHKTRTPLRYWFWMIFLMSRKKAGVSMLALQKMLKMPSRGSDSNGAKSHVKGRSWDRLASQDLSPSISQGTIWRYVAVDGRLGYA